jgi:hypothetical protein
MLASLVRWRRRILYEDGQLGRWFLRRWLSGILGRPDLVEVVGVAHSDAMNWSAQLAARSLTSVSLVVPRRRSAWAAS